MVRLSEESDVSEVTAASKAARWVSGVLGVM